MLLSYNKLKSILDRGRKDWVAALQSQKAVYLISDKNNGKMYVGSATSEKGMLLDRWRGYVKTGNGGNIELENIVNEKGMEYVEDYFQYSILENYNSTVSDYFISTRESWWKRVLLTRAFGYNDN